MLTSLVMGLVPSLYRYILSRLVSPLHDSLFATDWLRPLISAAIGYSSYLMWSYVMNPSGLYVRFRTTCRPSSWRSMQYGKYTALKSSRGMVDSFLDVKAAAYNKFNLLTNPADKVYPSAQVLNTPLEADSPAPESRGFFTSIDCLWPGSGQRYNTGVSRESCKPSSSGVQVPGRSSEQGANFEHISKEANHGCSI